ncbi:MAG: recombinase XerD [Dehalococcoidia bacterium]|nr:recombinase XerD [Dehalococcoidia bacterium]
MSSVLTAEDVRRLEAAARSIRDLLIIRLLYLHGPRRGELLAIEVQDVDLVNARLRLSVLKRERGAWRSVPLDTRTRELLSKYIRGLKLKPRDRLFPRRHHPGKRRQWGVSPHRLRDFSITRRLTDPSLRDKGLEGLKAVADYHGHRDPRSTLRYLRLTEGWREETFAAGMEELLNEGQQGDIKVLDCKGRCHYAQPQKRVLCFCLCYPNRPHGQGGM